MFDDTNKKYIIAAILIILVIAIASAGFGIWNLSKKNAEIPQKIISPEELIKSVSAPTTTEKTTQQLMPTEQKIINSVSAPETPKKSPSVSKSIIDSLSAPNK